MAILRCNCCALKTGQPFRASGQYPWECPKCAAAKKTRESAEAAYRANNGKSYPSAPEKRL